MKSASIRDAQVVRTPSVQKMSLWAMGTPTSPRMPPAAMAWSARAALARASSPHTVTKALRLPAALMRARQSVVSSTLLAALAESAACVSTRVAKAVTSLLDHARDEV